MGPVRMTVTARRRFFAERRETHSGELDKITLNLAQIGDRIPLAGPAMANEDYFARLARLLDLESRYEQWQTLELAKSLSPAQLEHRGLAITGLTIRDENP